MARQIENSLDRFAPGHAGSASTLVAGGLGLLLFIGVAVSLASGNVAMAGLLGVSLVGLGVYVVISFREQRRLYGRSAAGWIEWGSALPEVQRENLRIAAAELSRILGPEDNSVSDLQTAFIVAEDLALRQIQHEEGVPVMRHVSVAGVPFDAVFAKGDELVCGEVAFLVSPELPQARVAAMMQKITAVKRSIDAMNIGMKLRLMPVLITQMQPEDVAKLRGSLGTNRFSSTPTDVDIRLFDFDELQRIYVSDDQQ